MLTVITGPPCSGKTTYLQAHAKPGDVVIDYDALAVTLGSPDHHDHPPAIVYITKATRQSAINAAIGCHKRGATVWVIDGDPSPGQRRRYHQAGARWVELTATTAELHRRAQADRPKRWHALIDRWVADHGTQARAGRW